jgi:hypothetical protein
MKGTGKPQILLRLIPCLVLARFGLEFGEVLGVDEKDVCDIRNSINLDLAKWMRHRFGTTLACSSVTIRQPGYADYCPFSGRI